jgi:hypothetical protein
LIINYAISEIRFRQVPLKTLFGMLLLNISLIWKLREFSLRSLHRWCREECSVGTHCWKTMMEECICISTSVNSPAKQIWLAYSRHISRTCTFYRLRCPPEKISISLRQMGPSRLRTQKI